MIRRFLFRNERSFYKRSCRICKKEIISIFAPEVDHNVVCQPCWWSDKWDPLDYGVDYDFNRPFFEQFAELWSKIPVPALFTQNCDDSPYTNHTHDSKNSYLVFGGSMVENTMYAARLGHVKDSVDVTAGSNLELCYDAIACNDSEKLFYSIRSEQSFDSYFLKDCRNMGNSFACVNLRNKQYHIFNEPHAKDAYKEKLKEFDLGSYRAVTKLKSEFEAFSLQFPRKFANIVKSEDATGDNITNSRRCRSCFNLYREMEDCAFVINALEMKDGYDGYGFGVGAERLYEGIDSGIKAGDMAFTFFVHGCFNVRYCFYCHGSSHLFGCIGMRNKEFSILNKQYSKAEYERLVPQIIEHMQQMPYRDSGKRTFGFGEFFPPELSPFAYNETAAQEYFPLTKKQVVDRGYRWREPEERSYPITLSSDRIPDHIKDVSDSILRETIGCAHGGACHEQCTTAFKVIPQEFEFYKKMNIPVPRLCPNCRHYERLKQQNPYRLWHRRCTCGGIRSDNNIYQNQTTHFHGMSPCPNEFETSYAPDRPEIVYCEACYQAEVV